MNIKRVFIVLVLFASSLFIAGCSGDSVSQSPGSVSNGSLSLKFDKVNAPSDVVFISVSLTREGFNPIFGNMNILSDTSATLSLDVIPVGQWHLKVEAKGNSMLTLYAGETDVIIQEGIITQVSLALVPVNQGVGGIEIFVTWGGGGIVPSLWKDYSGNPLLSPGNLWWDFAGLFHPKVLYDGTGYKMYFVGLANASLSHTGYAVSSDGISWTRPSLTPVLSPGDSLAWDSRSAQAGAIIKENTEYKMYYVGWANHLEAWHIGLATSVDGVNWTKRPQPVIVATTGWEFQIVPFAVLKVNNLYYLYYTGRGIGNNKIGLATSTDGISFQKYSGNPILSASFSWEGIGITGGSIIQTDNGYMMVYAGKKDDAFGLATSTDGKNWIKDPANPVFKKSQTINGWGLFQIAYPHLTIVNNQPVIYYAASGYSSTPFKIGMIRKSEN